MKRTHARTDHLPITPNGFALLCLAVLSGGCWWRMHRVETPAHEFDELAPLRQRRARQHMPVAKPMRDVVWPADVGEVGPAPDGAWCQGRPRRIDRNAPEHRVYLTPVRRPGQQVRS